MTGENLEPIVRNLMGLDQDGNPLNPDAQGIDRATAVQRVRDYIARYDAIRQQVAYQIIDTPAGLVVTPPVFNRAPFTVVEVDA
jgi:hypothetical protein